MKDKIVLYFFVLLVFGSSFLTTKEVMLGFKTGNYAVLRIVIYILVLVISIVMTTHFAKKINSNQE